eukprot:scaffold625_cov324-Pavlova_lutheri.AAC.129
MNAIQERPRPSLSSIRWERRRRSYSRPFASPTLDKPVLQESYLQKRIGVLPLPECLNVTTSCDPWAACARFVYLIQFGGSLTEKDPKP